MNATMTVRRIY